MTGAAVLPAATGIVLAGGRSRRFGRDKLGEPLGTKPLLQHAIDALSQVTSEVVVVAVAGFLPEDFFVRAVAVTVSVAASTVSVPGAGATVVSSSDGQRTRRHGHLRGHDFDNRRIRADDVEDESTGRRWIRNGDRQGRGL